MSVIMTSTTTPQLVLTIVGVSMIMASVIMFCLDLVNDVKYAVSYVRWRRAMHQLRKDMHANARR